MNRDSFEILAAGRHNVKFQSEQPANQKKWEFNFLFEPISEFNVGN